MIWTSSDSGWGSVSEWVGGLCEQGNEPSAYIKGTEFLD
jgi:hypothetical protein